METPGGVSEVSNDELLAEGQILRGQVGPLGEQSMDDGPDEPQREHRHLSLLRVGAGVYSGWNGYKDSDGG